MLRCRRTEARKREVRLSARPTHSYGRGWPHQVRRRRARPHMGAWRRWARGRASRCPGADAIAAGSTTMCARGDVGVVRGPACFVILIPPGSSRSRLQAKTPSSTRRRQGERSGGSQAPPRSRSGRAASADLSPRHAVRPDRHPWPPGSAQGVAGLGRWIKTLGVVVSPTASSGSAFPLKTGSDVMLGPNVLSHLSFTWCQNPCLARFPMHLIE